MNLIEYKNYVITALIMVIFLLEFTGMIDNLTATKMLALLLGILGFSVEADLRAVRAEMRVRGLGKR